MLLSVVAALPQARKSRDAVNSSLRLNINYAEDGASIGCIAWSYVFMKRFGIFVSPLYERVLCHEAERHACLVRLALEMTAPSSL